MLKENSLKNKTILVTGGGSGLGKSMTKYFLDMKNRNQQTILKVSAEVKERLGDVLVIVSPRGIEANWEVSE